MLDRLSIQRADLERSAAFHEEHHPNRRGGFVRDLDGDNVEAVCRAPEEQQ